jgi:membrane protein YdbS with pleckstrin-like domain
VILFSEENLINMANAFDEFSIRRELEEGEELLYFTKPKTGVIWSTMHIIRILFGSFVILFAFLISLIAGMIDGIPILVVYVLSLFALIGVYMILESLLLDPLRRARTVYGLSPKRLIILHGLFKPKRSVIEKGSVESIQIAEGRNGYGSIYLFYQPSNGIAAAIPVEARTHILQSVPDAIAFFHLLERLKTEALIEKDNGLKPED